jgi:DNA-directed RNA polymerase specialized sigma24 family protein
MMQIVVNVDRDRRRRRRDAHELPRDIVAIGAAEPNQHAAAAELSKVIRNAIDSLPQRQREVALLSFK